jgi:eukaryotic-like serine/threonine-protein kinase
MGGPLPAGREGSNATASATLCMIPWGSVKVGPVETQVPGSITPLPEWRGTARYEVIKRIGAGGMGVVYEAFDRDRQQLLALKTLARFSPAALYRFKQEFRTLADVVHPNLVSLYELVATDADHVFFTMELVRGGDFLTHTLRPDAAARRSAAPTPPTTTVAQAVSGRHPTAGRVDDLAPNTAEVAAPRADNRSPADLERLRPALRQLAEGIGALHAAGKLHRDIKPSNVLVTPEGRVVLLDFGVATDISFVLDQHLAEREVVGTALYMAPEQATDEAPTAASDWYSVGVMLYEALVGRPPFAGPAIEVLARKSLVEPPPPSDFVTGVPPDLDALCSALLRPAPNTRPTGAEIRRWLDGGTRAPMTPQATPVPEAGSVTADPFIGRAAHLAALREAFDSARHGHLVTLRVHGSSGMGKSSLVQRFLDELVEHGEAVTLRGRAYERESMPYKALDSVVDALSRYLMRLSEKDPSMTLPRDLDALARLFPVLRGVERVSAAAEEPTGPEPAHVVRRRAIVAMRELLAMIAARQPLVLYIDDVQWGDVDSAGLLIELVRPPFDAPVLLLVTHREEESDSSAFLIETRALWPLGTDVRDVHVRPLAPDDAHTLALALLGPDAPAAQETANAIARESGGSPLLIEELARGVARPARSGDDGAHAAPLAAVRLESVVSARMSLLPSEGCRFLELVALSARPLPILVAASAAEVSEGLDEMVSVLRARRFVRTGMRDGHEVIEIVHDRIRETIVAQLPEDTVRAHHGRLARALEPIASADPEALATHLLGAGQRREAAKYAERAAEPAAAKLAFAQAARLYRLALDAVEEASADARQLRVRLADVLVRAGRGAEAASVYTEAAKHAQGSERMELEQKATEQLLLCGHIDEGAAALDRIFEAAGMRGPRTLAGAIFMSFVYRLLQTTIGLRIPERDSRDVRREDSLRIEALYAVVVGLSFVHVIYGMSAQARHLYSALRAGDRFQVFRAAVVEVTNCAALGGPEGARERRFAEIVRRLTEGTPDAGFRAFGAGVNGQRLFLHGHWRGARDLLDGLYEQFRGHRAGWAANWHLFNVYALALMGEMVEVRRHCATLLADAEQRGDLYTSVNLRVGHCNAHWLAADDVETARRHVREAMAEWSQSGFYLQHYRAMLAEANIELYEGAGKRAREIVTRDWAALRRSFLMRVQYIRADAHFLRVRCALASAEGAPNRHALIAEAARFARKLDHERMPWTAPLAALAWAGIANARGDRAEAIARLRAAVTTAEAADMRLHAAVARLRLGSSIGGQEGDDLTREAREWMGVQEIRVPERMAAMLAPGFVARG